MSINISFSLDEEDLDYFRHMLATAQQGAAGETEDEIVEQARKKLDSLRKDNLPGFFLERLDNLRSTIRMLEDQQWPLEQQERTDIVSALAYLYNPEDTIPDDVPVLGLLDDAIVIELVLRELRHEIAAYEEFCTFRENAEHGGRGEVSREEWLIDKRHQLFERMRGRIGQLHRTRHGTGRLTSFSLS